jgi:hypothetical protein
LLAPDSATTAVATNTFTDGTSRIASASGQADVVAVLSDANHFAVAFEETIAF